MRSTGTSGTSALGRARARTARRAAIAIVAAAGGLLAAEGSARAQEIQLTGPLAGAPAVRKLRLYREGRLEAAPTVSFTLLDEYKRTILLGARVNYNFTDWLAVGVWGGFGAVYVHTGLTEQVDEKNTQRNCYVGNDSVNCLLTRMNTKTAFTGSGDPSTGGGVKKGGFQEQLGTIQWVLAPQITAVPFRGKLAVFQKIFVDTDAYFFAGPAFVGLKERANCDRCVQPRDPNDPKSVAGVFEMNTRTAIAPTFGLGLTFYTGPWMAFGVEYRALPFSWNVAGFDTKGGGPDERFPDQKINEKDRGFKFNQMLTLSWGFYFPQKYKSSE